MSPPHQTIIRQLLMTAVLCFLMTGCEKPRMKFHPGDRVRVKLSPHTMGVICARLKPFVDDSYYLTVAGPPSVSMPIRERERERASSPIYDVIDKADPWHTEGPFSERELELAP